MTLDNGLVLLYSKNEIDFSDTINHWDLALVGILMVLIGG
jgi:hypothetical protein